MTEELKKALEAAVTDEQKKAVAEKFKEEFKKLSEDDLKKITGGHDLKDLARSLTDEEYANIYKIMVTNGK